MAGHKDENNIFPRQLDEMLKSLVLFNQNLVYDSVQYLPESMAYTTALLASYWLDEAGTKYIKDGLVRDVIDAASAWSLSCQ